MDIRFTWLILFLLTSCSGYRLANQSNPFTNENIKSIGIPLFINRSTIPNLSGVFTKAFSDSLSTFPELTLRTKTSGQEDAILIGIIGSKKRIRNNQQKSADVITSGDVEKSIGDRPKFYIPTNVTYNIFIRVVLIKNPNQGIIKLVKSDLAKYIHNNPKVIFDRSFIQTGSYARSVKETLGPDSEGMTNFTKSKYFFEKSIESVAKSTALSFKELVLNVF